MKPDLQPVIFITIAEGLTARLLTKIFCAANIETVCNCGGMIAAGGHTRTHIGQIQILPGGGFWFVWRDYVPSAVAEKML